MPNDKEMIACRICIEDESDYESTGDDEDKGIYVYVYVVQDTNESWVTDISILCSGISICSHDTKNSALQKSLKHLDDIFDGTYTCDNIEMTIGRQPNETTGVLREAVHKAFLQVSKLQISSMSTP